MTRKTTPFSDRLAYAIWLRHLSSGHCPGNAEIGRAAGVTGPAVTAWRKSNEPPEKRRHSNGLIAFFGLEDYEKWFLDGNGEPPRPELWLEWVATRQAVAHPKGKGRRIGVSNGGQSTGGA